MRTQTTKSGNKVKQNQSSLPMTCKHAYRCTRKSNWSCGNTDWNSGRWECSEMTRDSNKNIVMGLSSSKQKMKLSL